MKHTPARLLRGLVAGVLGGALVVGGVTAPAAATDPAVVPINWGSFTGGLPIDADSLRIAGILTNVNEYAVTTWWNTVKNFDAQSGSTYLTFGGNTEDNIRPPASEALALAAAIATGAYNPTATEVSLAAAKSIAVKLIVSLAYRHLANTSGGWGNYSAAVAAGRAMPGSPAGCSGATSRRPMPSWCGRWSSTRRTAS